MVAQRLTQAFRQHRDPIAGPFAVAYNHLTPIEVEILHAHGESLADAQAGSVEEHADQPGHALETRQHAPRLDSRHDDRDARRLPRANDTVNAIQRLLQNVRIQEQDRGERLVLRRGGDVLPCCQVRQERVDVLLAEPAWMHLTIEPEKPADPVEVCLLGSRAVMTSAKCSNHTVVEPRSRATKKRAPANGRSQGLRLRTA